MNFEPSDFHFRVTIAYTLIFIRKQRRGICGPLSKMLQRLVTFYTRYNMGPKILFFSLFFL